MILPETIQRMPGNAVLDLLGSLGLGQVNGWDEMLPYFLLLRQDLVEGEVMATAGTFATDDLF